MATKLSPESLAQASSRHPWRTVGVWVGLMVLAIGLSGTMLPGVLTTDAQFTNKPEAVRAADLIEDRLRPDDVNELFILRSKTGTVQDPEVKEGVQTFQQEAMSADDSVKSAFSFYDTDDKSLVSEDGSTLLVPVAFEQPDQNLEDYLPVVEELRSSAEDLGFESWAFGPITLENDFTTVSEEDMRKAEMFGMATALVVLVIVFGAFVAGLLPIAMGIGSITVALGIVALVGQVFEFSFFVTSMISMMGLAVGIDYSLFIVSRYREERRNGREKLDAIAASGATANRAVFFSGMTVVLALIGMLIVPTTIFRSLAAGSIFVVIVAVAASLTLLPALLALLGDRVNKGTLPKRFSRKRLETAEPRHGFWDRVTHGVMRRPVVSLVVGASVLVAASLSYFDINTGFAGVSTLPNDMPSKQAFAVLAEDFPGGLNSPFEVVVDGDVQSPEVRGALEEMQSLLASNEMFGPAQVQVNEEGDLAVLSAPVNADPNSAAVVGLVDVVRDDYIPQAFGDVDAEVLLGGETAFYSDFFDLTDTFTPIVFVFVLGLSFILLMLVFRSIVVPVKAILMNLLSVGAAYGLIVLVFQKGIGADLFGFQQVESIEAWLPLFLFSVLFGLSMDYHVFLLSRIKEHFDHTKDNAGSVAYGLRTTAGLITGAALIMVAVFAGFAAGDLVMMQQMGFGLAVAVLIDATIVRSVLVPASMKLLGDRNWYFPRWLQWLPEIHIEGIEPPAAPAAGAHAGNGSVPALGNGAVPERERAKADA
ncbi:MAG: MMPL family transporter [Actinomycetota bacterium]|nr:MMPL family transporter [Actinomycetota bacterium]